MPLAADDDMIQAIAPDRSNDAFDVTILPWRSDRDGSIANSHPFDPPLEAFAIRPVIVAHQNVGCRVPWKCFSDLSRNPF